MIWDYVVLDEGHQVKNSVTETSVACRKICSPGTRRLLLTGTPILNNLNELWSLFDFATSGRVLGSSREFKRYYGRNIEDAREKGAHQSVMELGSRKNKELQEVIRPVRSAVAQGRFVAVVPFF
jgi:SNF2 family DNA or RNA helicase